MWWQMISGAIGGWAQGSIREAEGEANNRLQAAEASNANRVRGFENAFAAAKGALARYVQSVNNNRKLDAGGEQLEANLVNTARRQDAATASSFEKQIQDAEQLGAQAASAAFAGVGGEVADTVSIATRLTQQRAAAGAARSFSTLGYDATRRAGAIAQQMVRSLDSSITLDAINYKTNVAAKQSTFSPWIAALAGAFGDAGPVNFSQTSGKSTQVGFDYSPASFGDSGENYGHEGRNAQQFGTGSDYGNQDYGNFI